MRMTLLATLVLAGVTTAVSAQSTATTPSLAPQAAPIADTELTLVGCVERDATRTGDWFTLSDPKTGTTYHLIGPGLKAFVWRNVRIVGGLMPSPNVAAQAGAIDPTKAAMAYQGASRPGIGDVEPLAFAVMRVRRLTGSCAPRADK